MSVDRYACYSGGIRPGCSAAPPGLVRIGRASGGSASLHPRLLSGWPSGPKKRRALDGEARKSEPGCEAWNSLPDSEAWNSLPDSEAWKGEPGCKAWNSLPDSEAWKGEPGCKVWKREPGYEARRACQRVAGGESPRNRPNRGHAPEGRKRFLEDAQPAVSRPPSTPFSIGPYSLRINFMNEPVETGRISIPGYHLRAPSI